MSYNQKPPGSSGSGMGGGPPNGPNNMPQVAKTFAGIQQQMQNLVHGQNAIPQSSQADINAFLQQQRIQNMLKQQQQFLQFQHQMQQQQQQHQQQQHQHHNMAGGGGVGPGSVGGVPGVGGVAGPGGGGAAGSGEPLALTRTAGAAELLNKTYQQQSNGNPASNPTFNQLQQTLQALPTNFVQHLQVFQYQMQAKQMQQQQHAGGQGQHGLGQQQPGQGVPPPPTTASMPHQQQQQQQQKHQNQQQQQQNALSRYLTAAAVQAAAASGNKMSSATPPPPPLTNQMKPPNLPPNTQITPVPAANISGGSMSASTHSKASTGNTSTGSAKHSAPPPSISLMPSKAVTSSPSVAHQQNKFTPPTNSGAKGGHMGHSQNLPKSTHGAAHTATSNTTSPAKAGANAEATVAALKSPQSTPVQLTKQLPSTATAAGTGNKTQTSATTAVAGATSTTVSPLKLATTPTTASASTTTSISTSSASVGSVATNTSIATANTTSAKPSNEVAAKPALVDELAAAKLSTKQAITDKETAKSSLNEVSKPAVDSSAAASPVGGLKKEADKPKEKEKKTDSDAAAKKPAAPAADKINSVEKPSEESKANTASNSSPNKAAATVSTPLESKEKVEKEKTSVKSNKSDNHDVNENEKNVLVDAKKTTEKNKLVTTDEKNSVPLSTPLQEAAKHQEASASDDLSQVRNSQEEKKFDTSKEKVPEKDKDKTMKANKSAAKIEQTETVASKDAQKTETLAEKPVNTAEIKPTSTANAQNIPDKTLKKDEVNEKKSVEANNKKDSSENEQNKKVEKQPVSAAAETDPAKISKASVLAENKKDTTLPKEKEASASAIPVKTIEKLDTTEKSAKAPIPPSAINKKTTEDTTTDSGGATPKETANAVSTLSAKKVGRLAKGAKSKSVAAASSAESKTAAELAEEKPTASSARVKRKPKADSSLAVNSAPSTPRDDDSDRKSKRHRLKTILYQSPLPELAYITKLSASEASNSPKPMSNEDRLIVFYKNEYMAVRNAEGTFYLCQTMQNVYRTSPRISIRWLSEDTNDNNVFIPDFYDHTDIECVLTTVELKRIDKGHLRLPKGERSRIESILKKAIDVEKGIVPRPELTEENPDGLDISLFKDESQIEKKSALTEGGESLASSLAVGRKSKRGVASSARKSMSSATPSTSSGYKRKGDVSSTAKSSTSSRKSLAKKRKTLVKRKRKIDHSDGEDDDDETSDDYESDTEYKPTQKRSTLNESGATKSAPRAQRSPLAKARAASPITPTTSRSKNVPQKTAPTPSTSKASRGERAAKRKSIIDAGSSEESSAAAKKPTTTSNNKSKAVIKKNKH